MPYTHLDDSTFWVALQQRDDLQSHGNLNAALYAIELHGQYDDICTVATEIITEGGDDENIDILFTDEDNSRIYLIQSFQSPQLRVNGARPNKARDSSYAVTALIDLELSHIPERIRGQVEEARKAIEEGNINTLHVWFLNNCPENSENQRIMKGVGSSAAATLRTRYPEVHVTVDAKEVGLESLDLLYQAQQNSILINETIELQENPGFLEHTDNGWLSFSTSVSGNFLKRMYNKFGEEKLFSANIRGYMGSNKKDQFINGQIQHSAESEPRDFFVCNNGITALVHDFNVAYVGDDQKLGKLLNITGISIVNGAQTTGCLSNLGSDIDENVKVAARFIKVDDTDKIEKITKANNSQNKVLASDFRAGDATQERLRQEFLTIPDAHYSGGLRSHLAPAVKRISLSPETVAQILIAYHDHPNSSYHEKKDIWENDSLYKKAFDNTVTAGHLLFLYTLHEAINEVKADYGSKFRHGNLISTDESKHEFLRMPGVSFIIIHAVASIMEMILGGPIANPYTLAFRENVSRTDAIAMWKLVINQVIKRTSRLMPATKNRLSRRQDITDAINAFREDMDMFNENFGEWFGDFKESLDS
ncbi:AIPR family protein [Shewanella zhangzhouensis]|uniref:AIPR family protein n=1 Tax=Shewanella zhangzhouensis TaxID=2864213 RepID=UPI001C65B9D4|nr:AIPR family protein [Shewanella zhangzhouensis]QYK04742.1 AIPR family protein [Shewanella zhangzhouensis]